MALHYDYYIKLSFRVHVLLNSLKKGSRALFLILVSHHMLSSSSPSPLFPSGMVGTEPLPMAGTKKN